MANASDSDSDDWEFESLRAGQEKKQTCSAFLFFRRDSNRAIPQGIETVRGTVSLPACVSASAKARRANLFGQAKKKADLFCFFIF